MCPYFFYSFVAFNKIEINKNSLYMNYRIRLFFLAFWLILGLGAGAQTAYGDLPEQVDVNDATITKFGHATMSVEMKIVNNPVTNRVDTLRSVTNIEWNTEPGTAKQRMAERERLQRSDFYDEGNNWWYDIYWYSYNYTSVNAEGESLYLSAMACMPDEDCDYVNNVIIGCHITIADNDQCPSSYNDGGSATSDVSLMMNHAGSGTTIHASQSSQSNYNLVILPDYEGYGITVNRPHPYLCEELTARQVVDAVRYGIALYKSSSVISSIRHPFRSNWRSICIGYSQGGGVALATQRFIEQNGLTDELRLAGSVCGAGPYDPIATLYYYAEQCNNGDPLKMPVLMPLIMKGMCYANPYMKNHQPSDYLSQPFLNTGILDMIDSKSMTTDEIADALVSYYSSTPYVSSGNLNLPLNYILTPQAFSYIYSLYYNHPNYTNIPLPTQRGVMEDLHYALESNNLTHGWLPQHAMFLYHSYEDTVVPESNRESASYAFGSWVIKLHASFGDLQFDHVGTGVQYFMGTNETNAVEALAGAPYHQTIQDAINLRNNFSSSDLD